MALTVSSPVESHVVGDCKLITVDVTPDSSYAISGESFLITDIPGYAKTGHRIVAVFDGIARKVNTTTTPDNFVLVRYDSTAKVLQFGWDDETGSDSAFVETASTTDLSTYTARLKILVK
jgi:hypothetical protein